MTVKSSCMQKYVGTIVFLLLVSGCQSPGKHESKAEESSSKPAVEPETLEKPCRVTEGLEGVDLCLSWEEIPERELEMHEPFTLALKLSNLGTREAVNSKISLWGNNVNFHLSSAPFSCAAKDSKYICTIPRVNEGDELLLRFTGRPISAGTITLTAFIENDSDVYTLNNDPRPFPRFTVRPSTPKEGDSTSVFLQVRQECVKKHGEDKMALRKCMIAAKNDGRL